MPWLLVTLVVPAVGCRTTRSALQVATGRVDAPAGRPANASDHQSLNAVALADQESAAAPEPSRDEAFAQILGDLQEIGAADPEAQRLLMEQLQQAKPSLWPLMVQQFKSTLAYSRQLRAEQPLQDQRPGDWPGQAGETRIAARPSDPAPGDAQASPATAPTPRVTPASTHSAPEVTIPGAERQPAPYPTTRASTEAPSASTQAAWPGATHVDASVRPVSFQAPPMPGAPLRPTSDTAAATTPGDWQGALRDAIDGLDTAAIDSPNTADEAYLHARLRLLQLAAGMDDAAVAPIPGLPVHEQAYWSKQLFAISTMLGADSQPDLGPRATSAAMHLADASVELSELGALTLRNLTFCKEVYGYGAYEPRTATGFRAGEALVLYVEVENFASQPSAEGQHTSFASRYRLVNEQGGIVQESEFPVIDDYCLSRRRDFHIQYGVTLPPRLPAGRYRLELHVRDQLADKTGHSSIELEVR
ncbi:hypothetical protein [Pirellulimonas nuda]|nr:hypothetical protein [Pirellulimonas nuda]